MKKILFAALLCFSFYSSSAMSQSKILVDCQTCDSSVERGSIAKSYAIPLGERSVDVIVMDSYDGIAEKFRVTNIISFEPGVPDSVYVTSVAFTTEENNVLSQALPELQSIHQDGQYPTVIGPHVAPSAWDLVGDLRVQAQVTEYASFNMPLSERVGQTFSLLLVVFQTILDADFYLNVSFSDGTSGRLKLTGINGYFTCDPTCPELEYEVLSLEDNNGEEIPLTKERAEALKQYNFNPASVSIGAASALMNLGLSWGATGGSSSDPCKKIIVEGDTITCVMR